MSLQFIIGQSGSGKSQYLYKKIIEESQEKEGENFIFVVPEQSTLQAERELVTQHPNHGILNIEVLSFARLAYNIMEETGTNNLPSLDDLGKSLIIRKVAGDQKKEYKVIGNELRKTGYINQVKSVLSEFMQYRITPKELDEVLEKFQNRKLLQYKLTDMKRIYEAFEEYRKEKYITSEELLSVLSSIIEKSDKIKRSTIVLDGYTGFTPVQMQVVEKLLLYGKKVYVTITLGGKSRLEEKKNPYELFAMSKTMYQSVKQIAEEQQIPIEKEIRFKDTTVKRYEHNPAMAFLEQNFFRYNKNTYKEPQENIQISSSVNPREELESCAREIKRLTRENYRYKDIAIIAGDMTQYGQYIEEIFSKYQIPVFVDAKRPLVNNCLVEFIRAAMEVVVQDFKYESICRFLKTPLHDISVTELDEIENYIRANGLRGMKKYKEKWLRPLKNMTAEELEHINDLRLEILGYFEDFYKKFRSKKTTVAEKTVALYEFLQQFSTSEKMQEYADFFEEEGKPSLAKEYTQVYEKIMHVLEEMTSLLGEEKISAEEYRDILEAGIMEVRIGVIPAGTDIVTLGELERSRLEHIKVLFVVGVNDGQMPKKADNKGVFSELEREEMNRQDMVLAPNAKEQSFIQRFYLYMQLTKPKDRLYLSYAKMSGEGDLLRPSYLIQTFLKMYPHIVVKEEEARLDQLSTPQNSVDYLAQGFSEYRQGEGDLLWQALYQWYEEQKEYQPLLEQLKDACFYENRESEITKAAAHALYGTTLSNSVTRLEKYAECAYAHFLSYGLQLREREEYQFASVDLGNVLHMALEIFSKNLEQSEYNWFDVPESWMMEAADKSIEESVIQYGNTVLFQTERDKYKMERAKQLLRTTVATLCAQVRKGSFVPKNYELGFSVATDIDNLTVQLSKEEKLRLRGRIDRVDTYEDAEKIYVKIIDYKSGSTTFQMAALYYGLQLQLVLYMDTAMKSLKKNTSKEIVPAGIFYYNIDDPMVDGEVGESMESIDKKIKEKLRMNGLVNQSQEVVDLLDGNFEKKSEVIPVTKNKDGSFSKTSKVVSQEDFQKIMDYVNKKIVSLGKGILEGDVRIHPYQMDKQTACDFCSYKSVCGFDKKIPGYSYEKLKKFSDEEVLIKIREEEKE